MTTRLAWKLGAWKPGWARRRSLRERIGLAMALLVCLVAGLIGGIVGRASEQQARARIGQSLAVDAQRLAERLNTEMAARARELALLASIDSLRSLPSTVGRTPGLGPAPALTPALAHTQSLIDELKASFPAYSWISVADPSGRVLVSTDPASVGADISTRAAPREGLRGPIVGPARPPVEDARVMDMLQSIRDDDGIVTGIVAAQLSWSWLRQVERGITTADPDGVTRREAFLISNQDLILLGPQGTIGQPIQLPAIGRARAGFYGWSIEAWPPQVGQQASEDFLTGIAFAAGEGPPPGAGSQAMRWAVLVREAQSTAFAPAAALREQIWLAGSIIAGVFALFGWLLAGMFTAPLARIAAAAERLRQGDDVELPRIRGAAEIDSLSASLRALVAALTRKQLALDEMEGLALRDPLTGLLNRHGLRLQLEAALAKARTARSSLFVFVGDLDGFKAVNDTLGHASGDQLLCQVAARLAHAVRTQDIVARIGGDEFVLAVPAPGGPQDPTALAVARRAQAAMSQPYELGTELVRVGCSLGGACWPEHIGPTSTALTTAGEIELVLRQADAALYVVKRSGKGRVHLHGDIPSAA